MVALIHRRQLGAPIRREFQDRIRALAKEAQVAGDSCYHKLLVATVYFGKLWANDNGSRVAWELDEAIEECADDDLRKRVQWLETALEDARFGTRRDNWSFVEFESRNPSP